jgi:hypothetical protein
VAVSTLADGPTPYRDMNWLLRRYEPDNARQPTIGSDWEFQVAEHASNCAIERHIVRARCGVIVWATPGSLIDPVSARVVCSAGCEMLEGFWRKQLTGPGPGCIRPLD